MSGYEIVSAPQEKEGVGKQITSTQKKQEIGKLKINDSVSECNIEDISKKMKLRTGLKLK